MACVMETRLLFDDDVESDMPDDDEDVIVSAVVAVEEWEDCLHLVVADVADESTKVGRAKANLGNDTSVEGCNLR